jgi:RND family efflux transporter MFP subunit
MTRRRKWIASVAVVVLFAAGLFAVLRARNATAKSTEARPFRLGKVQQSSLQVSVREVGVVDPVAKVEVKSPVSGRVIGLNVREGAAIKVGDVLAEVEPDVNQAQSLSEVHTAVTQTQLRLKDAEREYSVQKRLFDRDLVARGTVSEYETKRELAAGDLRAAQMRYRIVEDRGIPISGNAASQKARIKSPMAGTVIKRTVELGESVMSGVSSFNGGTVLFTVADLRTLIIRVNLNEVDIAKVELDQPVRVTLDAYPQQIFSGKVSFVAPAADLVDKIKVFKVEIQLAELGKHLRTGMSANVEILGEKRDNTLSIPLEALQKHEAQTVAYQLKKDLRPDLIREAKEGLSGRSKFIWMSEHWKDYFNVVPIKAGIATLERVEVLEGLSESDEVALEDPSRRKIEKDDENN